MKRTKIGKQKNPLRTIQKYNFIVQYCRTIVVLIVTNGIFYTNKMMNFKKIKFSDKKGGRN